MIFFFCFGFFSSNKSLYLKAITDALDMPRTAYSLATSFRFVTTAVIGMLLLSTVTNSSAGVVSVFIYAALSAVALPLETVMIPLYAKDLFGDKSYDRVMGIFYSINTFGYAVGGPRDNAGYDLLVDYRVMLRVTGFAMLAALIVLQFVITAAHRRRALVTTAK